MIVLLQLLNTLTITSLGRLDIVLPTRNLLICAEEVAETTLCPQRVTIQTTMLLQVMDIFLQPVIARA